MCGKGVRKGLTTEATFELRLSEEEEPRSSHPGKAAVGREQQGWRLEDRPDVFQKQSVTQTGIKREKGEK